MPLKLPFKQVDVFTSEGFKGNPVAVTNCLDIDESQVTTAQLQAVANWTNLSETTFIFKPVDPTNDYKLRIFTPKNELPFAGHPTIGSCKAYLEFTGKLGSTTSVKQECGVGIVNLTVTTDRISFQGAQTTMEDVDSIAVQEYCSALGDDIEAVATSKLLRTGPDWVVILVKDAKECFDCNPNMDKIIEISARNGHTGIILGGKKEGSANDYEIRAFAPVVKVEEDPVCGSGALGFIRYLNHLNKFKASQTINISQGGRLGRNGQLTCLINVHDDDSVTYHVGGDSLTVIEGQILL